MANAILNFHFDYLTPSLICFLRHGTYIGNKHCICKAVSLSWQSIRPRWVARSNEDVSTNFFLPGLNVNILASQSYMALGIRPEIIWLFGISFTLNVFLGIYETWAMFVDILKSPPGWGQYLVFGCEHHRFTMFGVRSTCTFRDILATLNKSLAPSQSSIKVLDVEMTAVIQYDHLELK